MIKGLQLILFMMCLLSYAPASAQLVYYQDSFRGGVTGGGFSPAFSDLPGEIELYIEPGSTVKRVFLFVSKYFNPESHNLLLNGQIINLQSNVFETNSFVTYNTSGDPRTVSTVVLDITEYIVSQNGVLNFSINPPPTPPATMNRYVENYVLIVYENNSFPEVNCIAIVNEMSSAATMNYNLDYFNPIDTEHPVGFAVHGGHMCSVQYDGSYVFVDDQLIGLIGGKDINNVGSCSGPTGTFYYQNQVLYGLSDDTANVTMNGPDALADISPYITDPNALNVRFDYQLDTPPNYPRTNPIWQLFFAYTSTCPPFETTLTERVTMCANDSTTQLLATGGASYEWWPAENLSCTDCPNPVFSGSTSANYHVKITQSESCTKILPVRVNVVDAPQSVNLTTTPANCGENDGALAIGTVNGGQGAYLYRFDENWISNPTSYVFSQLAAGDYTLSVKDQNNCYLHQPFTIGEVNPAEAAFTASPQSGYAPLEVDFINQSNGSTDYEWSLADSTIYSFDFSYTFDSAGSYPVQLVSWYNLPHCADTAATTVLVLPQPPDYNHTLYFPTDYNPQHGLYAVETTNIERMEWHVYNAVGQHIYSNTVETSNGSTDLWDGGGHARGYYFFRVRYWDVEGAEHSGRGKVLLMR